MTTTLTLRQPDDWHVHLREGDALPTTVPHSARCFGRAAIMPNLIDPVRDPAQAAAYLAQIQQHIPSSSHFQPLLSLYLTADTVPEWVAAAAEQPHLLAFKYYPAHATTGSEHGIHTAEAIYPILETMARHDVPLQVHGEVTDHTVDIFDREARFIETTLAPIIERFPTLRIVLEHITTAEAVAFVKAHDLCHVAATITPHHLLLNRNDLLVGGVHPHHYCLPILKRATHQQALIEAATSGDPHFFLGTDSAPHARHRKESACGCAGIYSAHAAIELYAMVFEAAGQLDGLEAFASTHGANFYQLPLNAQHITLQKQPWTIPTHYPLGDGQVIPLWAGESLAWQLVG